MNERIDAELMGLLTGELAPEKAAMLQQRLERDSALASRLAELEAAWRGLELPPPSPFPPDLRSRIVTRAEAIEIGRRELEWGRAPAWAQASAALALAGGIVLGVGVSDFEKAAKPSRTAESVQSDSTSEWSVIEPGLAELYAEAIEQSAWLTEEEDDS